VAFLFTAPNVAAQFDDDADLPKVDVDTVSKLKSNQKDSRLPYETTPSGGLNLNMPSNYKQSVEYDPETKEYIFEEKIGDYNYREPYSMSSQEYKKYDLQKSTLDYWVNKRQTDKGDLRSSFLPSLNLGGAAFDNIFGSNVISIVPQGSAELIFGLNTSKINNPNISENLRKTTTFDFQQKIQMNVTGSIGDRVKLGVKYNTEATFEFENETKLEYAGKEDDIIRKIEFGNVTMPLAGSLITGSQSLFGIKTELQFGKLNVTTVVSQQKGESSSITVKGGSQVNDFEIECDDYEANKHFFLDLFFRNNYEKALKRLPLISSGVVITKIEVWVTNTRTQTADTRNLAAFLELGGDGSGAPTNNYGGNNVYSLASSIREVNNITSVLSANPGYTSVKLENARKLSSSEYTLNANLGYISLSSALNADEVLAVAYTYTYAGKTYQVGELSTDGIMSPNSLLVKLIKGKSLSPRNKNMWNLMMKNVYSLNAYQLNQKNFRLNIMYLDDKNGVSVNYIPYDSITRSKRLLSVERLDQINSNGDRGTDGVYDFIDGVTVIASSGRIIFPTLEPFNTTIRSYLVDSLHKSESVAKKYTYPELYDSTLTKARLFSEKNKYKLKGTYESSSSSEISLNATNLSQGSVVVTAGGRKLTENIDYTVDYTLGRVKIINQGLLESQQDVNVSLESNSLFNFQTKTLVGTHLDYKFSDNFHLGGTIEHLSERPLTSKVNIGDEPISNTIWGLNGSYTTKSQFLTTMLDKIPFLDLKEPSQITIDGEFAQLLPGHSKYITKSGEAYIDDFEGAESAIDLRTPQSWFLASIPDPIKEKKTDISAGYSRAKLAWYTIDPLFVRTNLSSMPSYIKKDANFRSSHFVREIDETEIFKNKDVTTNEVSTISVLNLAYYPTERGPYNYEASATEVNPDGKFKNPVTKWGGIMREMPTTDFEAANIGFIEFWLMDPFVEDSSKINKGGQLYFNLGDVSEDVLPDSRKSFEDGLPASGVSDTVDSTVWGYVPLQSTTSLFNFQTSSQNAQDCGLDGMKGDKERNFSPFKTFLNNIRNIITDTAAYRKLYNDPSSDNFHYYRGSDYDAERLGILQRYKDYNGMDGNSPVLTSSGNAYSGTNSPNTEDINKDNTLDEDENYYQYKVDLTPGQMKIGRNFIVDSVSYTASFPNGKSSSVNWFQFRIPITDYEKTVGNIEDFQSIRFMRMYLNGFKDSVILRFARLQLIRGEWRKYNLSMRAGGESVTVPQDDDASFELSTVNIEDNGAKKPVNYVLPPGVSRQTDPSNPQLAMLNEQAMVMKVYDLPTGDARVAYKTVTMDMRRYKRLKMFVHAEQMTGTTLADNDLRLFIRMGTDNKSNFYEYEIPLKLTPWGTYDDNSSTDRLAVWPEDNTINILLEDFQRAKQARNDAIRKNSSITASTVYPYTIDNQNGTYYICGSPNLSNVRTVMIGIRKPYDAAKVGQSSSGEIWINELRLTDFDEDGGWAANLNVNTKLSDWGSVSMAGSVKTAGFGSIDQTINERSTENLYQADVGANLEMGKFFPEKSGVQIPMYVGYSHSVSVPEYNPLDPDIKLSTTLQNASSEKERDSIKNIVQTVNTRKSISFNNVKINKKEGTPRIYDVSNWSVNYSYSEAFYRDISTTYDVEKIYKGGVMYAYQLKPKTVVPLNNVNFLRPNYLRIIRDFNFNYLPTSIGFRTDMSRTYNETLLRNVEDPEEIFTPTVSKDFLWNRYYDFSYDITKSLKLDFSATNVSRIQEPEGVVDRSDAEKYDLWRNEVLKSIKYGGDRKHYQHDINLSYTIPINKLPGLGWTSANARYNGTYAWDRATIGLDSLGNTINNSNSLQISGQANFSSLYNNVPYFKRVLQPKTAAAKQKKKYKTIVFEKERVFFRANEPKAIVHKLKSEDVKVKVVTSDGKEVKGKMEVVNENKVNFTPEIDCKDAKVSVEGKVEEKPNPFVIMAEHGTRLLLCVKNASISWTRTQGMSVAGFMPSINYLGNNSHLDAPGSAFVLGYQDRHFMDKAINKGWLSTNKSLSTPSTMSNSENLNIRVNLEPVNALKIELFASRSIGKNNSAYYVAGSDSIIKVTSQQETGNLSISVISISSSFEKLKPSNNYESEVFKRFLSYRTIIAQRLAAAKKSQWPAYNPDSLASNGGTNGYGINSQNVLIPAFMAAYCDRGASGVTLKRIPTVFDILPNWRVSYDGLSKIDKIKQFAKTVTLSHYYKSTYTIGSYVSTSLSVDDNDVYVLDRVLDEYRDLNNNFIPHLDVSSVSVREQFGPLIGINITFINDISTSFEMRKDRNVVLSLSNNQITDNLSNEWVVGFGYKFKAPGFIIRTANNQARPDKNDINVRGDFSIRDNKTIIRKIIEDEASSTQVSSGQDILTFKLSADYDISSNFNIRLFYDLIVNNPIVTTSYPTSNSNIGFSVKFSLAQ
jgi:cell surface protein SprA